MAGQTDRPRVLIVGGGFGGLWAAKALAAKPVDVTLIDRKNHHVFQPLLYQVATAVLSPGEIARKALAIDFKAIDTRKARVMLFEGSDRILGTFGHDLSDSARSQLESLGVEVFLNSFVTDVQHGRVKVGEKWIDFDVGLWAT